MRKLGGGDETRRKKRNDGMNKPSGCAIDGYLSTVESLSEVCSGAELPTVTHCRFLAGREGDARVTEEVGWAGFLLVEG